MRKILRILAVSTLVLVFLAACGKAQGQTGDSQPTVEKKTTFIYEETGEYITLTHTDDMISGIVIGGEEAMADIPFNEGETAEERYKERGKILKSFDIDFEYEIKSDSVASKFIVDLSKVTKENVQKFWGNKLFMYNGDGTANYPNTVEKLKENGYVEQ